MGAILILVVMFMPMGFVGLINMLKLKWQQRSAGKAQMEKAS